MVSPLAIVNSSMYASINEEIGVVHLDHNKWDNGVYGVMVDGWSTTVYNFLDITKCHTPVADWKLLPGFGTQHDHGGSLHMPYKP